MNDGRIPFAGTEVLRRTHATDLQMTYSELDPLCELFERHKNRIGTAVLVYTPADLSFGVSRMLVNSLSAAGLEATEALVIVKILKSLKEFCQQAASTRCPRYIRPHALNLLSKPVLIPWQVGWVVGAQRFNSETLLHGVSPYQLPCTCFSSRY